MTATANKARPKPENLEINETSSQVLRVKKVLVPIDFSEPCRKAFKYALGFARQFGSEIVLIHVIEPPPSVVTVRAPPAIGDKSELILAEERMQALADAAPREGNLYINSVVRTGLATHEIVETAKKLDVDVIIIATHGLEGWKPCGMGRTADRVARAAPCPVLIVREKEHEFV